MRDILTHNYYYLLKNRQSKRLYFYLPEDRAFGFTFSKAYFNIVFESFKELRINNSFVSEIGLTQSLK